MGMQQAASVSTPRGDLAGSVNKGILLFEASVEKVFRPLRVPAMSGKLAVLPPESLMAMPSGSLLRAKDGSFPYTESERTEMDYKLASYGLNHAYDDSERAQYETLYGYESSITQMLFSRVRRVQEARFLAQITTTNFATGTRGHSSSNPWATPSSGDPAADGLLARKGIKGRSGILPNAAVMSWLNLEQAWKCDALHKNHKYTQNINAAPRLDILAGELGVEEIILWGGKKNTANEGATPVLGDLENTDYVFFCRVARTDSPDEPCTGRTLFYDEYGGLGDAKTFRKEENDNDVYRYFQTVQEKRLWDDTGWLMVNAD